MYERERLKILMVSAEVVPFAKTGGLADVAGSLPQALAALGHDVRIAMPRYRKITSGMHYVTDFPVSVDWHKETCVVKESEISFKVRDDYKKVQVYFLDNYQYFDREHIYCYFDEAERFAFFCRAAIDMLPRINFQPDIIHCNDWHTGPICMLLSEQYKKFSFYSNISTVFTVHNLKYQGNYPGDTIKQFNVDKSVFTPDKVEFYGMFSFMKAGLVYADIINTVSETYAREIQTEEYGERLEGLLKIRSHDLYGIVNGISYDEFNPATDPRVYRHYDINSIDKKKENKSALQVEMNLPVRDVPVIGLVSRLVDQKGLDLIKEEMDEILENDVQFVLLGLGDPYYENFFRDVEKRYPEKVGVAIEFNATLAQRIYAGSDMFLMPSRFEPCGLGQLISLRYGTIPIVRATGGLLDTIKDYSPLTGEGNGFSFKDYRGKELLIAVNRAWDLYNQHPDLWRKLVEHAMSSDFSWVRSAEKYLDIYYIAIGKKKGRAVS